MKIDKIKQWVGFLYRAVFEENLLWTVFFICYCFFYKFFESVLDKFLVVPFFSTFQDNFVSRISICLVLLFIAFRFYRGIKNKEIISYGRIYRFVLVLLLWGYYRFFSDIWTYTEIYDWGICYIDIIPVYCFAIISIALFKMNKVVANKDNAFIIDNPIESFEEDIFGRRQFAESMAGKILDTQPVKGSFAVSIVAPWGNGKTSFINLIKKSMSDKAIIMDYAPWKYGTSSNLTNAFFSELKKKLKDYDSSLSDSITRYSDLLEVADNAIFKFLYRISRFWNHTLEESQERLENTLEKLALPIVVFIDDLDRLEAKEILEVLKIIRNTANFKNIRFVSAYDKEYIIKAIKVQNIHNAETYLEKFFQVEYVLPELDRDKIIEYLELNCFSFIKEKDKFNNALQSEFAMDELRNMRDVKRFINMLQSVYKYLEGEIDICDLMNLTVLKLKYLPVYNFLSKYYERVLFIDNGSYVFYSKDKLQSNGINEKLYNQLYRKIDLVSEWDKYFEDKKLKNSLSLLRRLFPESSNNDNLKINSVVATSRYFYDVLLEEDFSSIRFNGLWKQDYEDIIKDISKDIQTKVVSFCWQIERYKINSQKEYENIVRVLLYIGTFFEKGDFSFNFIISMFNLSYDKGAYKSGGEEHKKFIFHALIENSPSLYVCSLLYNIELRVRNIVIPKEKNREIRFKHFAKAIEQDLPMDKMFYYLDLMQEVNEIPQPQGGFKEQKQPINGVFELFRKYAERHLQEFILRTISDGFFTPGITINYYPKDVWGGWDNWEEYIKSVPKTPFMEEYIELWEKFKANDYQSVDFEFNYIPYKKN